MKEYEAFEAKTYLSEILGKVINGEKVVITKHGEKVAMIIPFTEDGEVNPARSAIRAIKNLRKGLTLGKGLSIREMIDEGRR